MLAGDEFDDTDLVALGFEEEGAGSVGDEVGLALFQQAEFQQAFDG